jgi:hypothetical protein
LAGRKDEYVKDCFKALPKPKDGYDSEDCRDPRHRKLLAFLAPIVYPDKPNRITVTLGNTIFGALIGGRKVNWARIITNLVIQLASRVGKTRASPICPFLYHLYERRELLKPEEERAWKIQEGMMKYGESGSSDESGSGSGSEDDTEDDEEKEENDALNLELGTLISESQAARKHGDATLAAAERIRAFAHQAGEVVAKAELFDEKVGVGSKPSGTRIAMILSDYTEESWSGRSCTGRLYPDPSWKTFQFRISTRGRNRRLRARRQRRRGSVPPRRRSRK